MAKAAPTSQQGPEERIRTQLFQVRSIDKEHSTWELVRNAESPTQTHWMRISLKNIPSWCSTCTLKFELLSKPSRLKNYMILSQPHVVQSCPSRFLPSAPKTDFPALSREQWGCHLSSSLTLNSFLPQRGSVTNPVDQIWSAGRVSFWNKLCPFSYPSCLPTLRAYRLTLGFRTPMVSTPGSLLWGLSYLGILAKPWPQQITNGPWIGGQWGSA